MLKPGFVSDPHDAGTRAFDPLLNAYTFVDERNRAVHDGDGFTMTWRDSASPGGQRGLVIQNGDARTHIRELKILYDRAGCQFTFYEDAGWSNNLGSPYLSNNNRIYARQSQLVIFETSTIWGDTTLANIVIPGTGNVIDGGSWKPLQPEWILKPNTNYGLKIYLYPDVPGTVEYQVEGFLYEVNK